MKVTLRRRRLAAAVALFLCLSAAPAGAAQPQAPGGSVDRRAAAEVRTQPLVVRVGVIAYDDYAETFRKYEGYLKDVARESRSRLGRPVIFRLAVGSYSDVLKWYTKDQLDLAFFTPEPVVELLEMYGRDELSRLYVATHDSDHTTPTRNFDYRAMCVVNETSPIKSDEDLIAWARRGRVNFHFVHPLSASGNILPRYALLRRGISLAPSDAPQQNQVTWTYSSSRTNNSLGASEAGLSLDDGKGDKASVGFLYTQTPKKGLRSVPFPGLDDVSIPQEVLLINRTFDDHLGDMEKLFDVKQRTSFYQKVPDWIDKFEPVAEWRRAADVSADDPASFNITLEQLGSILRNYEERAKKPARVALVLSGGGAKCAYQLGAIEAIEDELSIRPEGKEKKVDIGLVVGTSGGAINALLVGLGLTRGGLGNPTRANEQTLEQMWKDFDQKDFFRPYTSVNVMLGICVGLSQGFLVVCLAYAAALYLHHRRLRAARAGGAAPPPAPGWRRVLHERRHYLPVVFLLGLALLDFVLYVRDWAPPWRSMGNLGMNHFLRHGWMVLTLNLEVSALTLALLAVGLFTWQWFRRPLTRGQYWYFGRQLRFYGVISLGAIFVLSLFIETTLSRADGVERMLCDRVQRLVSDCPVSCTPPNGNMEEFSRCVETKLQRDLVITGSNLQVRKKAKGGNGQALPEDLYFYHDFKPEGADAWSDEERTQRNPPAPSVTDQRFRDFNGNVLDVVIGSSSIYPVFPFRPLPRLNVNLIDGGFVHNSPIDAAVSWKATHIILVEVSPEATPREAYLLENASIAFNHLYTQAQLLDARARGKGAEIFTLRPTPSNSPSKPDLCTFDFSEDLVGIAIARGRLDANSVEPHFRREPGAPNLIDIGVEANE